MVVNPGGVWQLKEIIRMSVLDSGFAALIPVFTISVPRSWPGPDWIDCHSGGAVMCAWYMPAVCVMCSVFVAEV